jgi:peroxiredoxin
MTDIEEPGVQRSTVSRSRRTVLVGGAIGVALLLSSCTEPGSQAGRDGATDSANGTITEWSRASRRPAVRFQGRTETGTTLSSAELRGNVAVLNFWYAGCPPCRAEAPDLQALWEQYRDDGVRFVGVNVRDDKSVAQAFTRTFGITYPSILDEASGGQVTLALSASVSVKAVPTTLVLDRRGRVAARILGRIPGRSVLSTLIRDTLAEGR